MKEHDARVKQFQEFQKYLNNLKCCGNCYNFCIKKCKYIDDIPSADDYCSKWIYDGLTQKERMK